MFCWWNNLLPVKHGYMLPSMVHSWQDTCNISTEGLEYYSVKEAKKEESSQVFMLSLLPTHKNIWLSGREHFFLPPPPNILTNINKVHPTNVNIPVGKDNLVASNHQKSSDGHIHISVKWVFSLSQNKLIKITI